MSDSSDNETTEICSELRRATDKCINMKPQFRSADVGDLRSKLLDMKENKPVRKLRSGSNRINDDRRDFENSMKEIAADLCNLNSKFEKAFDVMSSMLDRIDDIEDRVSKLEEKNKSYAGILSRNNGQAERQVDNDRLEKVEFFYERAGQNDENVECLYLRPND